MEQRGLGNRRSPNFAAIVSPENHIQSLRFGGLRRDDFPEGDPLSANGFSTDQTLESALSRLSLSSDFYHQTAVPFRGLPAGYDEVARVEVDPSMGYHYSLGLGGQQEFNTLGLQQAGGLTGFQNGGQDLGYGGANGNLMVDPGSWDCGPGTSGLGGWVLTEPSGHFDWEEAVRFYSELNNGGVYDHGYSFLQYKKPSLQRRINSQFSNLPENGISSASLDGFSKAFMSKNLISSRNSYNNSQFGEWGQQFDSLSWSWYDLRGIILSLAKDQNGSRILQEKLEKNPKEDEIEMVISEVVKDVSDLMKNQFGSYFVQKLFGVCIEEQRTRIIAAVTETSCLFIGICLNPHGARVMQKLLENLSTPEQISLVTSALSPEVVRLANDPNGQHVIRHCLINYSLEYSKHLLNEIANNCFEIATDKSGCCVLQCYVERAHGEAREYLIKQIVTNALHLAEDPYGNYVVQHLLGQKIPRVTEDILRQLQGHFVSLSCNKYASNVVEKFFIEAGEEHSNKIIMELLISPNAAVLLLDPFGNFVIQKALSVSKGPLHNALCNLIQGNAPSMRSNLYGRKVLSCLEKKKPNMFKTCTSKRCEEL